MSTIGNLIKKILGTPDDISVSKIKPGEGQKTIGDIEWQLAQKRAREQREQQEISTLPKDQLQNADT